MTKRKKSGVLVALCLWLAFALWTALVCVVNVQAIGPQNSKVGFATLNAFFQNLTGMNTWLYNLTDWLGFVPIAVAVGFFVLGIAQWIARKDIRKVDFDILALGVFYIVVGLTYALFEFVVINYRPVLIEGILEASYPSSTTMLASSVMPTAMLQLRKRIANKKLQTVVLSVTAVFTVFMVVGRLIAGVHWFSDIVGGLLFSGGAVLLYYTAAFVD
jgi:undecaprenyl-diphosphatase